MHEDMKFSIALEIFSKLLDNYYFHFKHENQPYGILTINDQMKKIDSSSWNDIMKIVEAKFLDNMQDIEMYKGTNFIGVFKK